MPSVSLKRELWAKLLTTALGTQFPDSDDLFVEHTLLVVSAEIIAHAVVGFELSNIDPAPLVRGQLFSQAQINGVVEADFFDWLIEVPGGNRFIRSLARRLARFSWVDAEHDVMKVLYESIIGAEQRKKLGEYYTPDWLANRIVASAVQNPGRDRVLDPACGSGSFLFHAVRTHLAALSAEGLTVAEQIDSVTRHVLGTDIHPVAVTLARVTYLLAVGHDRLRHPDRPPMTVPVFLGDSIQWSQRVDMFTMNTLVIPTKKGRQLFPEDLRFPERLLEDAGRFDRLVAEMADRAASREAGSPVPSLTAVFRRYAVREDDQPMIAETFALMCSLHDQGRDHIWGYYVRNLARPVWLSQSRNRVDVLVGNPPWLAYRYMTEEMQASFKEMSEERGLWHGASVATHQDLSGLFVARAIQLYLRVGGRFGFVMPEAALSRRQFKGFRLGHYKSKTEPVTLGFTQPWSLHKVKPAFFPVPASVVFGSRTTETSSGLSASAEQWSGRLRSTNDTWSEAEPALRRDSVKSLPASDAYTSPYQKRFAQGATVVPRVLFVVEEAPEGPLGAGAGRRSVRSARSKQEKKPWKELTSLHGSIETQFVKPLLLGHSVIPYMIRQRSLAVIPWDEKKLLNGESEDIDLYPGLAEWWRAAEETWITYRSSSRLNLVDRLNYRKGVTDQFPASQHRIVYTKSGMYLAACRVADPRIVIDHELYWANTVSSDEGRFLCALLNSPSTTELVRPLQARGEHNPRHFDKYVWQLPFPLFEPANKNHARLASLAAEAENFVAGLTLPTVKRFESIRRFVRNALEESEIGKAIDSSVREILGAS